MISNVNMLIAIIIDNERLCLIASNVVFGELKFDGLGVKKNTIF